MKRARSGDEVGSACGPLRSLNVDCAFGGRRGKDASGQAAALHWSGLRFAPTTLRPWRLQAPRRSPGTEQSAGDCSVSRLSASGSRPRRITRFVRCAHCAQTDVTSQFLIRAARGATSPVLLGAPEARCDLPGCAFADNQGVFATRTPTVPARQAVPGEGDFCGFDPHSPGVGARSALRQLTRRSCLNAANAVSVVCSAARPQGEHHSAVGAKRRPPQHEPPAGTACRARPTLRRSGRRQAAAPRSLT